jgi:hypothetical protein
MKSLEHLLILREQAWRGDVLWLLAKKRTSKGDLLEGNRIDHYMDLLVGMGKREGGWDGHDPQRSSVMLGYRAHMGYEQTS